jgi:phosphatidylglycerophosphate synthase
MSRRWPPLVIDARPRGPDGPLALERVLGKPVLAHLIELATPLGEGPVPVHARQDEHGRIREVVEREPGLELVLFTGPPPEGSAVLRTDRLYDPARLRRALRRGNDPEAAVIWRLDQPLGLAGAADELKRRQTYQPLGRYWALAPARLLARALCPTRVRPNTLTLAAGALVLAAAVAVAFDPAGLAVRLATALALALALVIDTADGHLARLQGTASALGHWLDATLDELGDMALHAGIAWAAYLRTQHVGWLLVGMFYGMGKYLFTFSASQAPTEAHASVRPEGRKPTVLGPDSRRDVSAARHADPAEEEPDSPLRRAATVVAHQLAQAVRFAGHADVRWHVWIALAALGRLEWELLAFSLYFPARTLAGAIRKVGRHG